MSPLAAIWDDSTYLQSMDSPLGHPRVVFTIGKMLDPSAHALRILAGRYQAEEYIPRKGVNKSKMLTLTKLHNLDLTQTQILQRIAAN